MCSGTRTVSVDRVRIIGERINPTGKKRFKEALLREDMDYILDQALQQTGAGPTFWTSMWACLRSTSPP